MQEILKELAEISNGCFHSFSSTAEVYTVKAVLHNERVDVRSHASTRVDASNETDVKDTERSRQTRRVA